MRELHADILIVGGGVGGCAAAMAATALGCRVVLTESTDWLAGQLTSQATPPDEHPWIEQFGCTSRYRQFRDGVRAYYRSSYPLHAVARQDATLNPGLGIVSNLCHEPRVALAVIERMLAPARAAGRLRTLLEHDPVRVDCVRDHVRSVTLLDRRTQTHCNITADYVLDATELGDLLPLAGCEYVCGAESQSQTGEPHAVAGPPQPHNVQALTWCLPVGYDPATGAEHVIDRPRDYDTWQSYVPRLHPAWPGRMLSWCGAHPITLAPRIYTLFSPHDSQAPNRSWQGDVTPLWPYRRIIAAQQFAAPEAWHDVTLINWPQNDYLEGSLIDRPADQVQQAIEGARQLSLSLLYWLQTEAPREDGGEGYPALHVCPELVGTADGLAKAPYIRESRRIRARTTITEQHVGAKARAGRPAEAFADSVGIGYYRIDLHPTTGGDNYIDIAALPFRIPLGALIPARLRNLLPACKNIGTTHITNGCYRLHPVEWNIGEAAGSLAAYCLRQSTEPHALHEDRAQLDDFQKLLVEQGFELAWPSDDLRPPPAPHEVGQTNPSETAPIGPSHD